jgi:hypothetical protein
MSRHFYRSLLCNVVDLCSAGLVLQCDALLPFPLIYTDLLFSFVLLFHHHRSCYSAST